MSLRQTRLSNLVRHCNELISAVRETGSGVDADEIERAVGKILERVSEWRELDDTTAILTIKEILKSIEECHHELTTLTNRFMVALSMRKKGESQEREVARQRDPQQLPFDMIADLREKIRKRGRPVTPDALQWEQLPQTQVIQLEGQGGVPEMGSSPLSKSAVDYTGRVSRISEDPVIEGTEMVFYIGEWISDCERIALGRLRDQSPDSQKRFKEWIEASLGLQHRNILNFVGYGVIDNVVYSINPWMENGNIREYIQRNPDVDRARLLSEVASGVEFLHERDIVHGDLCDRNILINHKGKAFVYGFDLFKFLNSAESHARWFAPERITSASKSVSVASPTEKADIWSFGLLCLEVFTGKDPFHTYPDSHIPLLLTRGTHPEHPGSAAVGLSPKMWDLMESCWQIDPVKRPLISEIQSMIRDMLSSRDSRQPPAANVDLSAPALFTPPVDPVTTSEASTSVGMSSPFSLPWQIGIPPVTQQLNVVPPTTFLGTLDRQTDTLAPISLGRRVKESIRRREFPFGFRSSRRSPDTSSSEIDILSHRGTSNSGCSCASGKISVLYQRNDSRASEKVSKAGESSPEANVGSLSSRSVSNTSGSSFGLTGKRSHDNSQSATLSIILPRSRKWDPISPVVLDSMEKAATGPEGLLRSALDGTVSAGNLEGLVSRVISDTADSSENDRFRSSFITIYQLFATSERLFDILKRRFETTVHNPVTLHSQYSILLFIESWLKKGFGDEELKCSLMIKELVLGLVGSELVSETMEAKAREIASLIEDPNYVHLRQPKNCTPLRCEPAERPQGMMPADLAAALTVVEGDRFKCITYWDYVNFTRQQPGVRRIEVFNIVHDLVTVWVQTTILRPDLIDERMKMYEEWIYTAEACQALNNLSSTSAIVVALISPMIMALALTCESKARHALCTLVMGLTPTAGAYRSTLEKVATKDLIPWLDLHLSTLNSSLAHSNPVIEMDGHPLVDFKQCSKVAEEIEALVQYSPPRTRDATRPDVLAYVEYSLKSSNGGEVMRAAKERSAKLAREEQFILEQRKKDQKVQALGSRWSPPRRKLNLILT